MTAQHVATSTPLTKELVADMRTEVVEWLDLWKGSLAAEMSTTVEVVERVVSHVLDEAVEHVQIRFAATLATFGISS